MLALFSDKTLYVIHLLVMYCFMGFHVSWGSVLKLLLEDWKLYQPKILRPGDDLLAI